MRGYREQRDSRAFSFKEGREIFEKKGYDALTPIKVEHAKKKPVFLRVGLLCTWVPGSEISASFLNITRKYFLLQDMGNR